MSCLDKAYCVSRNFVLFFLVEGECYVVIPSILPANICSSSYFYASKIAGFIQPKLS